MKKTRSQGTRGTTGTRDILAVRVEFVNRATNSTIKGAKREL